jgi:hypothetical protein
LYRVLELTYFNPGPKQNVVDTFGWSASIKSIAYMFRTRLSAASRAASASN